MRCSYRWCKGAICPHDAEAATPRQEERGGAIFRAASAGKRQQSNPTGSRAVLPVMTTVPEEVQGATRYRAADVNRPIGVPLGSAKMPIRPVAGISNGGTRVRAPSRPAWSSVAAMSSAAA